jgi:hypothetical protein
MQLRLGWDLLLMYGTSQLWTVAHTLKLLDLQEGGSRAPPALADPTRAKRSAASGKQRVHTNRPPVGTEHITGSHTLLHEVERVHLVRDCILEEAP